MIQREIRNAAMYCEDAQPEVRQEGNVRRIRGYAVKFNSRSSPLLGFREIIRPGAFRESLERKDDIRALINHDPGQILGRTRAGTLNVWEDSVGLAYEITPPDTQAGRDVVTSIGRGDLDGSSFGFRVDKDGESWSRVGGETIREINNAKLLDVSVVAYPVYPSSEASLRSLFPDASQESVKEWINEKTGNFDPLSEKRSHIIELQLDILRSKKRFLSQ